MEAILQELKDKFSNDNDFFAQRDYLFEAPVVLLGFRTLIDLTKTKLTLQKYIDTAIATKQTLDELKLIIGEVKDKEINGNEAIRAITQGKLIIYFENDPTYVVAEPIMKLLDRAIEPPINENVILGSISSFTEDIHSNIGILRKQLNSDKIRVNSYFLGSDETTELSLLYYEGYVNMELIHKIITQIEKNKSKEINNLQKLSRLMGFNSWVTISKFNQTELPQEAANFLRKGRAILFLDRLPVALVLPAQFWDVFVLDSDRNLPLPLMLFLRALRIMGALVTLTLPGLYVALVSVNPEVLRIELALSIAQSREGVPYPAIVEILLMLVILELIIEASIRLPKNIGPTITMVGGIILGQAVVQAKLVSNLLIIILAATTIANSTIIGLQTTLSLRVSKYVIVILASIYGVLGILEGLVLVCAYIASLTTFGIPYVYFHTEKDEVKNG
ncbi:spore germination protein [Paenibacillus solisilvae]|uniref:Spore germination protein n=1 Tax=Paenibacillus solisilvae TaxID=2486751 RepID=A0ABW0VXL0_9BACL